MIMLCHVIETTGSKQVWLEQMSFELMFLMSF